MNAKTLDTTEPRKPNAAIDCGERRSLRQPFCGVFRRLFHPGFTLAEMLIVLLILGVLATVAVQSLAPVMDQSRFEATQRTLENIRAGIIAAENSTNAPEMVTGFVADMGRLPISLDELLLQPADAPTFGLQTGPAPYADSSIPRGWRGPYVRLPVGGTALLDGWGLPFQLTLDNSTLPTTATITSLAANRPTQTAGYTTDIATNIGTYDWQATEIRGKLYVLNGNDFNRRIPPTAGTWEVTLLSPGSASVNSGVNVQTVTATTSTTGDVTYKFTTGLSIGPRMIRVTKDGAAIPGVSSLITLRPRATHDVDLLVE